MSITDKTLDQLKTAYKATLQAEQVLSDYNEGNPAASRSLGRFSAAVADARIAAAAAALISIANPDTTVGVKITGTLTAASGATSQLVATQTKADLTTAVVTSTATYASSNTAKATVSATGLVTGVQAGTCTITATFGGVASSAVTFTVT